LTFTGTDCGRRILGQHSVFSVNPRPPPPPAPPPPPPLPPAPMKYFRGFTGKEVDDQELSGGYLTPEVYPFYTDFPNDPNDFQWNSESQACAGDGTAVWVKVLTLDDCETACYTFYGSAGSQCSSIMTRRALRKPAYTVSAGGLCVWDIWHGVNWMLELETNNGDSVHALVCALDFVASQGRRMQDLASRIDPRPPPSPPSPPPPSPTPISPSPNPPPSPADPPAPPGYFTECGCHCFVEDDSSSSRRVPAFPLSPKLNAKSCPIPARP
jgi:hypothetical protein